ncbi:two-component system copper resistance phosphate regulon response regulator CusR [Dyadobacter sp. BE34]|uniref:Two-component system copper resistance phosphate regulon response regulator CusR n=1 Tax=Dyadobacter fermentans TaxID=94254 RepID=A0ABU1QZN2_9BACT|nr:MULTISPECIES: response regulator transcription factor [Dyadobacter]MDR6806462.1 two-component system copper resistance phosphate regulon response regulator CusR [Dyadobacter fermentans]MDR7044203.1 two-component system copper resistance phosphate regulon response regulator CusR [Dyadobacter sp. BE242]MDR7198514.1 two-component system copper resistance phosphate regulon response regulator CusR [Dyadobacter sp. BE34]MDR7216476.1 two-component system copper resistance phosphate regulon response
MKLLLIEDEPKTLQSIRQGLEENGYEVDIAYDGLIGKQLARSNVYQLIISDIIIPGINGIELCREIRSWGDETPILMLTALGSTDDKVTGLDAGADDYLVKPFEFKELLARVRALTKRGSTVSHTAQVLRFADLEVSLDAKTVYRSGNKINLTAREFNLLVYLIRNQGRVISKVEIAEQVWDIGFDTGTNVIEVYVNYLRKKIDKDYPVKLIHTQFGMGYVLKVE